MDQPTSSKVELYKAARASGLSAVDAKMKADATLDLDGIIAKNMQVLRNGGFMYGAEVAMQAYQALGYAIKIADEFTKTYPMGEVLRDFLQTWEAENGMPVTRDLRTALYRVNGAHATDAPVLERIVQVTADYRERREGEPIPTYETKSNLTPEEAVAEFKDLFDRIFKVRSAEDYRAAAQEYFVEEVLAQSHWLLDDTDVVDKFHQYLQLRARDADNLDTGIDDLQGQKQYLVQESFDNAHAVRKFAYQLANDQLLHDPNHQRALLERFVRAQGDLAIDEEPIAYEVNILNKLRKAATDARESGVEPEFIAQMDRKTHMQDLYVRVLKRNERTINRMLKEYES